MAKVILTKPILILLYGFPGAGKTYFARQLCDHLQAAHVQSDRIRHEVFKQPTHDRRGEDAVANQLAAYMAEEFLSTGVSVVYDANASRAVQRRALRELARRHHAKTVLVWLQIDAESSFLRSIKRDKRKIDDKYSIPLDRTTFDAMISQMQNPKAAEDYVVISGKHAFRTQLGAVMKRLREVGLLGVEDAGAHVVKPGMVNLIPNRAPNGDLSRRNIVVR